MYSAGGGVNVLGHVLHGFTVLPVAQESPTERYIVPSPPIRGLRRHTLPPISPAFPLLSCQGMDTDVVIVNYTNHYIATALRVHIIPSINQHNTINCSSVMLLIFLVLTGNACTHVHIYAVHTVSIQTVCLNIFTYGIVPNWDIPHALC